MIKIDFAFDTKYGRFADALHLPDDHSFTDNEIEALKQQRLNNWIAILETPVEPLNPAIVVEYAATPDSVLPKLLQAANLTPADILYDLGCGDGNVIIQAALTYGCKCVGFELRPEQLANCNRNVETNSVSELVSVIDANIFDQDLSEATAIYLWLGQSPTDQLEDKLFSLPAGTKIITFQFYFKNHTPTQVVVDNDNIGYVWIVG